MTGEGVRSRGRSPAASAARCRCRRWCRDAMPLLRRGWFSGDFLFTGGRREVWLCHLCDGKIKGTTSQLGELTRSAIRRAVPVYFYMIVSS